MSFPAARTTPKRFQQSNIAADSDQEAVTMIKDRPPEIIADKAGITTKQCRTSKSPLSQYRLQVATLAGIGVAPASSTTTGNRKLEVPHERQPHFAAPQLGDHGDSSPVVSAACVGRAARVCWFAISSFRVVSLVY